MTGLLILLLERMELCGGRARFWRSKGNALHCSVIIADAIRKRLAQAEEPLHGHCSTIIERRRLGGAGCFTLSGKLPA